MTTTLKFKASELRRLLANAILFAAPEKDCLPRLTAVRFEWGYDDRLFAVASNRYIISWEESWPVEADGRDPFSISVKDAKKVIAMLPKSHYDGEVQVQYDPAANRIEVTYVYEVIRFAAASSEFVRWRTMVDRFTPGEHKTITITPAWLALLAKVDADSKAMPVHFELAEDGKPIRVSIGEHFKALVMPIKNAG